jgi:orotate phosphoribosyltransferase
LLNNGEGVKLINSAEEILQKSGAILEGHFVLASGVHSPIYWEKFRVLEFPNYAEQLCGMIADHFRPQGTQVVAGPTTGGIVLSFEVAKQLGVRGIFAEKEGTEQRAFRRGFTISPGERVLVVDDIITSGNSVRQVIEAVTKEGGTVIGVGVLVNRSEQEIDFGVPFFCCHRAITLTYPPENCPLCAAKIPVMKPGTTQNPTT